MLETLALISLFFNIYIVFEDLYNNTSNYLVLYSISHIYLMYFLSISISYFNKSLLKTNLKHESLTFKLSLLKMTRWQNLFTFTNDLLSLVDTLVLITYMKINICIFCKSLNEIWNRRHYILNLISINDIIFFQQFDMEAPILYLSKVTLKLILSSILLWKQI